MRILVVEDDVTQLQPLQGALTKVGHIVDGAEDGEIAQWLMQQRDYDLLILDWMLPKINGVSLCGVQDCDPLTAKRLRLFHPCDRTSSNRNLEHLRVECCTWESCLEELRNKFIKE